MAGCIFRYARQLWVIWSMDMSTTPSTMPCLVTEWDKAKHRNVRPYSTVAAVLVSLWTQHNVRWILELVQDCISNEAKHHFKKL